MNETSVDDLFADDVPEPPKATPPAPTEPPKRKPRPAAKPKAGKVVIEDMSDEELAVIEATESRRSVRVAAEAEIQRRAEGGRPVANTDKTELIDNAVNIRRLDWECVCGNTNTLDLQMCGKCRAPRYS